MSALTLRKSLFPTWTSDLFDTGNLFSPGFFDFNGDQVWNRVPTVNIRETDKDYQMELAVPGMQKNDFHISIDSNMLTISCEKKEESSEKKENYTRREFSYNSFSRSFHLPENSVPDKIDAKYDNGLLKLSLPKKEVAVTKPAKEITVM